MTDKFQCDCCGAMVPDDQIATVIAYGIETSACDGCRVVFEGLGDLELLGVRIKPLTYPHPADIEFAAKICPVFRAIMGG